MALTPSDTSIQQASKASTHTAKTDDAVEAALESVITKANTDADTLREAAGGGDLPTYTSGMSFPDWTAQGRILKAKLAASTFIQSALQECIDLRSKTMPLGRSIKHSSLVTGCNALRRFKMRERTASTGIESGAVSATVTQLDLGICELEGLAEMMQKLLRTATKQGAGTASRNTEKQYWSDKLPVWWRENATDFTSCEYLFMGDRTMHDFESVENNLMARIRHEATIGCHDQSLDDTLRAAHTYRILASLYEE